MIQNGRHSAGFSDFFQHLLRRFCVHRPFGNRLPRRECFVQPERFHSRVSSPRNSSNAGTFPRRNVFQMPELFHAGTSSNPEHFPPPERLPMPERLPPPEVLGFGRSHFQRLTPADAFRPLFNRLVCRRIHILRKRLCSFLPTPPRSSALFSERMEVSPLSNRFGSFAFGALSELLPELLSGSAGV